MMRPLSMVMTIALLSGCASTNRNKILTAIAIGGATGILIGATRSKYPQANATIYGGLGAAAGGVIGAYAFDPDKELVRTRSENELLQAELAEFRSPKKLNEIPATFGARIPEKFRSLVRPGSWKVSEIDTWIDDGENRLVHQDKVMELTPPALTPGGTK